MRDVVDKYAEHTIEVLERAFPLRVVPYRLRRGSAGAGWSAGGEGIEPDLQMLEDVTV